MKLSAIDYITHECLILQINNKEFGDGTFKTSKNDRYYGDGKGNGTGCDAISLSSINNPKSGNGYNFIYENGDKV